jgi:hypothetical protein
MPAWDDVFTADEVARATGVPVSAVAALVASGELRPLPGTRFFAGHDVIRATWRLRATAVSSTPASIRAFFARSGNGGQPAPSPRPFLASCAAHVVLFIAALALSSGSPQTVATAVTDPPDGLVYLMMPGPGGGGGGSGARERRPPARIARIGTDAVSVPVLQPEPAVSPIPGTGARRGCAGAAGTSRGRCPARANQVSQRRAERCARDRVDGRECRPGIRR